MSIRNLFCHVDDFCQWLMTWENARQLGVTRKRGPAPRLSLSEVMTVLIHFHQSHYRDFKAYDTQHVCKGNYILETTTRAVYNRCIVIKGIQP